MGSWWTFELHRTADITQVEVPFVELTNIQLFDVPIAPTWKPSISLGFSNAVYSHAAYAINCLVLISHLQCCMLGSLTSTCKQSVQVAPYAFSPALPLGLLSY